MPQTAKQQFDPIDPRWLLKAAAIVVLAAILCAYLTLCLLFYQGQWQLILHPSLSQVPLPPPAQPIRFDAAETGTPRLSGALLPADPGARYTAYTVLYLRGGDSSLAADPTDARNLALLHALGLNVFAFDYRGYGQSDPIHPNQVRMTEDARGAYRYLTETRAVPETRILLYGTGVGAGLAVGLAAAHPNIPALILDTPGPTPLSLALADPRTRLLPVRALFHEDFPLTPLATLPTSKLLLVPTTPPSPQALLNAATPRMTVSIPPNDPPHRTEAIARYLDQTLHPGA